MPNEYKKRAKGMWRQGKGFKGDSEERGYAKVEVAEELKASDDEYLTPHKSKRKKNKKAILEHWIQHYTKKLKSFKEMGKMSGLAI